MKPVEPRLNLQHQTKPTWRHLEAITAQFLGRAGDMKQIDQLKQTTLAQGAASATGLDQSTLAEIAYTLAVGLPYSRRAEFAADTAGLAYVQRAGYDPRALPAFLTKLVQSPSVPVFLSSHPAPRDRIEALEEQIASGSS
jgi:predicted Zn-dependent protease